MKLNKSVLFIFATACLLCFSGIANALSIDFDKIAINENKFTYDSRTGHFDLRFTATTETESKLIEWTFAAVNLGTYKDKLNWSYKYEDQSNSGSFADFTLNKTGHGDYRRFGCFEP